VPTLASARTRTSPPAEAFPDSIVLARWENAESLLTLLRGSYTSEFQLVLISKPLSARARIAAREAVRLDAMEAPRREAAQRKKEAGEASAARDKRRRANKAAFVLDRIGRRRSRYHHVPSLAVPENRPDGF
jgi:hypothetical protein